jgi:hypothetical protein
MDALILIDVLDSHGMMLSRQRLALSPGQPLRVGRDLGCDVVLSDPYVAPRHAELSLRDDGSIRIDDLGTINGLIVADKRVEHFTLLGPAANHVQVGHSHLRIRISVPLDPERPDRESTRSRVLEYGIVAVGGLLCAGFAGFDTWVSSPDAVPAAFVRVALSGSAVLAGWFALWMLLGRAVRSRWQWLGNAAITLGAAASALWLWWGAAVAAFASGLHQLYQYRSGGVLVIAALALFLHLRTATRLRKRTAAASAVMASLIAGLGWLWFQEQQHGDDADRVPAPAPIFPPEWSRHPGTRLDRFLDEGLDLRSAADQHRAPAAPRE